MFGIIADLISSATAILLPAYLSYKALRTNDPAQTHPWLIYFTILSLTLLFESWPLFIIGWIPFYSWLRLFFLLYHVLPQTQGAKHVYLTYLEPYIVSHEKAIDDFIGQAHAQLQELGLGYLSIVIDWLRDKVLGQASPQSHAAQAPGGYASYASDLLSRFAMPAARSSQPAAPGTALYSTLSSLAGYATSSRSAAAEASSIPDSIVRDIPGSSNAERSSYINSQRDRLTALMRALDSEQQNLDLAYGSAPGFRSTSGGLKTKSRSEQSFENVDYADAQPPSFSKDSNPARGDNRRQTSGGWVPAAVTSLLGGAATEGRHGDSVDYDDRRTSRGWSAARDITEEMAHGADFGKRRGREYDE